MVKFPFSVCLWWPNIVIRHPCSDLNSPYLTFTTPTEIFWTHEVVWTPPTAKDLCYLLYYCTFKNKFWSKVMATQRDWTLCLIACPTKWFLLWRRIESFNFHAQDLLVGAGTQVRMFQSCFQCTFLGVWQNLLGKDLDTMTTFLNPTEAFEGCQQEGCYSRLLFRRCWNRGSKYKSMC